MGKEVHMGDKEQRFKQNEWRLQKLQIDTFNQDYQKKEGNEFGLGYLDMNTRALAMEYSEHEKEYKEVRKQEWEDRKKAHIDRKKAIESYWHESTRQQKTDLERSGRGVGSNKKKEYYAAFNMKELEVFIKNSNRSGNSDEFNDVATELELYNHANELVEENERTSILFRLSEACAKYISIKNPITGTGKQRKAMIEALHQKVEEALIVKKEDLQTNAKQSYDEIKDEQVQGDAYKDQIEHACNANYSLISQHLMGNVELDKEANELIDANMVEILKKLDTVSVDKNQSNIRTAKFMNAIGWSKHNAEVVPSLDYEKGQLKFPIFHTIRPVPGMKDAREMIEQMKGSGEENRQFYSEGHYGKGTYTAARKVVSKDISPDDQKGIELDKHASDASWVYGEPVGSMQLKMMFNQNARIIDITDAHILHDMFKEKYPKLFDYLSNEKCARYQFLSPAGTTVLAFFGFNTIHMEQNGVDYYVTTDRKAFTIENNPKIKTREGIEDFE